MFHMKHFLLLIVSYLFFFIEIINVTNEHIVKPIEKLPINKSIMVVKKLCIILHKISHTAYVRKAIIIPFTFFLLFLFFKATTIATTIPTKRM